jgi:hypothetical protein
MIMYTIAGTNIFKHLGNKVSKINRFLFLWGKDYIFFLSVLVLELGPCVCVSGALPLELCPRLLFYFAFCIGSHIFAQGPPQTEFLLPVAYCIAGIRGACHHNWLPQQFQDITEQQIHLEGLLKHT